MYQHSLHCDLRRLRSFQTMLTLNSRIGKFLLNDGKAKSLTTLFPVRFHIYFIDAFSHQHTSVRRILGCGFLICIFLTSLKSFVMHCPRSALHLELVPDSDSGYNDWTLVILTLVLTFWPDKRFIRSFNLATL